MACDTVWKRNSQDQEENYRNDKKIYLLPILEFKVLVISDKARNFILELSFRYFFNVDMAENCYNISNGELQEI